MLAQSYSNLELIVIDDGSTDVSLNYLRTVRDPRYTLIEQTNSGAHNAINKGLLLAKGEYLAILNSDDVFHPERIAVCVARLKNGTDLVATWIELINQKGKVLGIKKGWHNMLPWSFKQPILNSKIDEFTLNLLVTNFVSTTSNIVFTRRLYETTGGMRNLRFVHDWDFLLRAVQRFRCELIEMPLLKYRTHETNTISSNRSWMIFEICWIFAVHLKHFTGLIFPNPTDFDGLSDEIEFFAHSINLQGNDKVLCLLLQYLDKLNKMGLAAPEEVLIDNEDLRNVFIHQVV